MNFWRSLEGIEKAELLSADPGQALQFINQQNIHLYGIEKKDDLTIRFYFSVQDRSRLIWFCRKRGYELRILNQQGLYFVGKKIFGRPVLLIGMLILLAITLILPTRVLFFRVDGNQLISDRKILEAAETCGITFGISRRAVRSEKMKNALLDALPELKWAGINTSGCVATISVRERTANEDRKSTTGVRSIAASRDGYIISCTVTQGNGLCTVGQVVKEGQVLISGYTDCGMYIQAAEAEGEIYALTNRSLEVITPVDCLERGLQKDIKRNYSVILGKKRINLWKCSGISDATCGRMYEEYYITLPGGFRLPICLAAETVTYWDSGNNERCLEEVQDSIKSFARNSVLQQMRAGQILREVQSIAQEKQLFHLQADYVCSEMIGRVITEEIGDFNGKIS